ncbi:MAG: glycerol-3-phosphate 1-O-acyltransferase PlsY, partial [Planctomycetota bacterium]|nr:glycerol-3-phosphate 1-O-acyltransferase PlsY [Planctomycetota bacterium]
MSEAATHFGWFWWTAIAIAFLAGSTPCGVMIARSRGVDILNEGSGNPGATNVGRVLGRRFGIACFLLDACKGAAPVLVSGWLAGLLGRDAGQMAAAAAWGWMAVAVAAILGHCFSPFLRFRGGKGVATGFGSVLAMWPVLTIPAITAFLVWAVILGLTRFMSLASMIGAIVLPATVLAMAIGTGEGAMRGSVPFLVATGLIAAFVVFRHRGNIARLRRGEESSVG